MSNNDNGSHMVGALLSKKQWEDPDLDPELVKKAADRIHSSTTTLNSVIASEIANVTQVIYTTKVDTLAVTLLPDGFTAQLINPYFVLSLEKESDLSFIRTHEIYHLLMRHLWGDRALKGDEIYIVAQEATINERVQRLYSRPGSSPKDRRMPMALNQDKGTFEETGVNPYKTYERYRKDLKEQGLDAVEYADFYSSDIRCYGELKRMKKDPSPRGKKPQCTTGQNMAGQGDLQQGGSGDQQQGASGDPDPHVDDDMLKEVVQDGLQSTIKKAHEGEQRGDSDNKAKDEVLDLMDMPDQDENTSTMWGDMGAGALRGEATETRKVEFWKQYLNEALHVRLVPGERMVYNQKKWWEPSLGRKGDEENMKVLIALDTSGSMPQSVVSYVCTLLGEEDDLEIHMVAFDTEVYPFELGDTPRGGGGTSIRDLQRYISDEMNHDVDAVICITDGYFEPTPPEEDPDKWVFLITPCGDGQWMDNHGLTVIDLDMDVEMD